MTRVLNAEQLKEMIANGVHDFFIQLEFGGRSSKIIDYDPEKEKFHIIDERDGSKHVLGRKNLYNSKYTNIGYAINNGSFFSYE